MATLNDLTPEQAKKWRLLGNKIFRAYPGSPKQKELIAQRDVLRQEYGLTTHSGLSFAKFI